MDKGISLVVAATRANGIGISSRGLPWRLPGEMAYFVKVTSEAPAGKRNAVVMGRNTWESIPPKFRPLKNRLHVVISSQKDYNLGANTGDTILASSLPEAFAALSAEPQSSTLHRTFIIGGAQLYSQALALPSSIIDRVLLTRIASPEFRDCDVFLPEFRSTSSRNESDNASPPTSTGEGDVEQWKQAPHLTLVDWAGFDVRAGEQEEKEVRYEFQMWVRGAASAPASIQG